MKVKLLDLAAETASLDGALEAAAARVLRSGQFILGEEVAALERAFAAQSGKRFAIGASSGTDALLVSLWALGVGHGDEVVTSPLSFFATAGAITRLGARPVFADIDPETLNLDELHALSHVGGKTKALLPVHLFGRPAPLTNLLASGLPVVEDAAQAILSPGVGAGTVATYSFFPSKNLGGAGDGGLVLTDDEALADKIRLMRAHGSRPKYIHHIIGGNFRLDALQAAIVATKLPHLPAWQAARQRHVAEYRARLDAIPGQPLRLPSDAPGHVWHHFVVRAPRRDELRAHLAEHGVETEVYYPLALHLQPCFAELGYHPGALPHAEAATQEVLALPIHPQLQPGAIEFVASQIAAFYSRR